MRVTHRQQVGNVVWFVGYDPSEDTPEEEWWVFWCGPELFSAYETQDEALEDFRKQLERAGCVVDIRDDEMEMMDSVTDRQAQWEAWLDENEDSVPPMVPAAPVEAAAADQGSPTETLDSRGRDYVAQWPSRIADRVGMSPSWVARAMEMVGVAGVDRDYQLRMRMLKSEYDPKVGALTFAQATAVEAQLRQIKLDLRDEIS